MATLSFAPIAPAQRTVSFPTEDGARIAALIYGTSYNAVLLVHGGRFTKESWAPQVPAFRSAGFEVMAIDLRGVGQSHGPGEADPTDAQLAQDVLAAVRYLHAHGARTSSMVGGTHG